MASLSIIPPRSNRNVPDHLDFAATKIVTASSTCFRLFYRYDVVGRITVDVEIIWVHTGVNRTTASDEAQHLPTDMNRSALHQQHVGLAEGTPAGDRREQPDLDAFVQRHLALDAAPIGVELARVDRERDVPAAIRPLVSFIATITT